MGPDQLAHSAGSDGGVVQGHSHWHGRHEGHSRSSQLYVLPAGVRIALGVLIGRSGGFAVCSVWTRARGASRRVRAGIVRLPTMYSRKVPAKGRGERGACMGNWLPRVILFIHSDSDAGIGHPCRDRGSERAVATLPGAGWRPRATEFLARAGRSPRCALGPCVLRAAARVKDSSL